MDRIQLELTVVGSLTSWFRKRYLLSKWRRRRRRKKNIHFSVSTLKKVFEKFDEYNIRYVVLRWFDEVPLTLQGEDKLESVNDIDILVDTEDFKLLALIASQHPGNIRFDVYNRTGRRGMSYASMPYYPPALASIILDKRVLYHDTFYVPEALTYFRSLAFHLVYHKGLDSGIPSGCHLQSNSNPKRPYQRFLTELGQGLGIKIEQPYTLLGLHEYLKQCGWEMPYDLFERWPHKSPWHQYLLEQETKVLEHWAEKLPNLLVFFIRQDLIEHNKTDMVYQMLEEKFSILKKEQLDQQQIGRVMHKVRGGNWIAHNGTWIIPPQIAVICYDHNPVPLAETDVNKIKSHPFVKNKNVFHKQEIRTRLTNKDNIPEKVFGIHGSDNAYEAQHMLRIIYTENTPDVNRKLFENVQRNIT